MLMTCTQYYLKQMKNYRVGLYLKLLRAILVCTRDNVSE